MAARNVLLEVNAGGRHTSDGGRRAVISGMLPGLHRMYVEVEFSYVLVFG